MVDSILGGNSAGGQDAEWIDKDDIWQSTSISISIPFHSFCQLPGLKDFHVGNFHHLSMISIICEKLADLKHNQLFDYEFYELQWQPLHMKEGV